MYQCIDVAYILLHHFLNHTADAPTHWLSVGCTKIRPICPAFRHGPV